MGTPEFALPTLRALLEGGVEMAAVITRPDRPAGRGQQTAASPVKRLALERGLEVLQPQKIRDPQAIEQVRQRSPEIIVVVGYGQIIPRPIFDFPPLGTINMHASLLPKYRGAAPIQWAIAEGAALTGVTTMRIEEGLDTGDILLQREAPVGPQETAPELSVRLAAIGAELLMETLEGLRQGRITPRKQNHPEATLAPILKKENGRIDWKMSAPQIANRVRGFLPWPGAYTSFRGALLHIRRARPAEEAGPAVATPGALAIRDRRLLAACGQGWLDLLELQPEGKKRLTAGEFLNGWRPVSQDILGEQAP